MFPRYAVMPFLLEKQGSDEIEKINNIKEKIEYDIDSKTAYFHGHLLKEHNLLLPDTHEMAICRGSPSSESIVPIGSSCSVFADNEDIANIDIDTINRIANLFL